MVLTKTKLAAIVVLTAAIAASVGGYLTFHLVAQIWITIAMNSMSTSARADAATVKLLRANKQDKAIELLCIAGKETLDTVKKLEADMNEGVYPHNVLIKLPKIGPMLQKIDNQRNEIENNLKLCGSA